MKKENLKPTLREIANQAGLHPVTVSRILTDTYSGSPDTASKVRKLAQKMGYQTSIFARAMRGSKMPFVLISGGHDAYTGAYLRVLEAAFHAKGLSTMLSSLPDELPDLIDRFRPIATILLWSYLPKSLEMLTMRDDVIIFHALQNWHKPVKCHQIRMDFRSGYAEMGKYLLECGHRHFAFVTFLRLDESTLFRDRRLGLQDAVGKVPGTTIKEIFIDESRNLPRLISDCLASNPRPTAMLCEGDMLAWQVIFHLGQLRIGVPQDMSVTGCDGIPLIFDAPSLTTVHVDYGGVAKLVTSWITDDIAPSKAKRKTVKIHNHVHSCYLGKKATVAPPGI